jgi:hypothetical protein
MHGGYAHAARDGVPARRARGPSPDAGPASRGERLPHLQIRGRPSGSLRDWLPGIAGKAVSRAEAWLPREAQGRPDSVRFGSGNPHGFPGNAGPCGEPARVRKRIVCSVIRCGAGGAGTACHAEGRGFESHRPLQRRPAFAGLFGLLRSDSASASPGTECGLTASPSWENASKTFLCRRLVATRTTDLLRRWRSRRFDANSLAGDRSFSAGPVRHCQPRSHRVVVVRGRETSSASRRRGAPLAAGTPEWARHRVRAAMRSGRWARRDAAAGKSLRGSGAGATWLIRSPTRSCWRLGSCGP